MTTETRRTLLPPIVSREAWQAERDALLVKEKAHTRAGDAIAAARRRLPMVEVDASTLVVGLADGGGLKQAVLRPVTGAEKVARMILGGLGKQAGTFTCVVRRSVVRSAATRRLA